MAAVPTVIRTLADLKIRLGEISRSGTAFDVQPDETARAAMAATLGVVDLPAFAAKLDVALWLDGAEVRGVWSGTVTQTCGVSLEDFQTLLGGEFIVRVVPPGSPHAPVLGSEIDLDPDADDPPDLLEDDVIDLAAYVVEHLALEIDPFPRKPGAVFEPPKTAEIISPFASLRDFKS